MTPEEIYTLITNEYEFAGETRRTLNTIKLAKFLAQHLPADNEK